MVVALAQVVASMTSMLVTAAGAATASVTDPDDVATPLDIKTVAVTSDASAVTYTDTMYGAIPDDVGAEVGWLIDADNDGTVDYVAGAAFDGTSWDAAVLDPTLTTVLADATVTKPTADSIAVSVARSAIGSPVAYTFYSVSRYDLNRDGAFQGDEVDRAPDVGVLMDGKPVFRVAGADRLGTAIAASQAQFVDGAAGAVVLARADNFPDALAGTPLAIAKRAPLLLNPADALDAAVEAEIRRVLPSGRTVYLLGGSAALSDAVASRVGALGYAVTRFAGADRYDTALRVADEGLGNPTTLLLTTGSNFPDALSAGAAAGARHGAVLLTAGSTMPAAVDDYLAAHPAAARTAIGGPAAQADPRATPVVGADRYDTSRKVADAFFADPAGAAITSGANFPDALSGGARTAGLAPLLLTEPATLTPAVRDYLAAHKASLQLVGVFGGKAALAETVRRAAETAIN